MALSAGLRRMRAIGLGLAVSGILGAVALTPADALAQAPPNEYQLKAVFLFNFTQFVEWPEGTFPTSDAPLIIGVLGDDPFGKYLDEIVQGEVVNSHPLVIRRYRRVEDITTCHILFVSRPERTLEPVLDSLKGRAILTVGDAERFAGRGGMIRFVTDRNKIRLHINLAVAQAANLKLSSKLLRPAEIVATGKE